MKASFKNNNQIAIILCTYNGAQYLSEQLESIIKQTFSNWTLYIRDDGSTDNTIEIIHNYLLLDNRIIFCEKLEKHIGPQKGFIGMLECVESELYMFCDQDDVWLPTKIQLSVDVYNDIYVKNPCKPIVVNTDVAVVDENLAVLESSHWLSCRLNPDELKNYNYLAICCYTQGNTMLFNNEAKKISFPYSGEFMHDWWISTRVIKSKGIIKSIYIPTLLYRQHSNNVLGFKYGNSNRIFYKILNITNVINDNLEFYKNIRKDNYGSVLKFVWYKIRLLIKRYSKVDKIGIL